ncbi:hypothetical protein BDP81DRAFT_398102 [Colletotrichum phormii]|uniref:Uncharacterized protein n=1 Tax=Colletotrichum phormii TaxID=359342 RepID=A0AAI9ZHX9_9PEZI|nr:uncharacterized protein BDP81DRAFT_398102 [Colletotrichum phormii]KAK1624890.1 hypothetical protein BDP81DRAFT_398102 [Colletotrichum phormii]
MDYRNFIQVLQMVMAMVLVLIGTLVVVEKLPLVLGNKAARQAAKELQELQGRKQKLADLMDDVAAAHNFAINLTGTILDHNQEARDMTVDLANILTKRIVLLQKVANISKSTMKQHLDHIRKFNRVDIGTWNDSTKVIQECIKLNYGKIKAMDAAIDVKDIMERSLYAMSKVAKQNPSPFATASAAAA